jgi:uncharacterized protein (DUF1330 family)
MSAYVVAELAWRDPAKMKEYFDRVTPIIQKFGGRYLVRGPSQTVEGTWTPPIMAVLEFPDMASLQGWYGSPEYAPWLKFRQEHATTKAVVSEGFAPPR